MRDLLEVMAVAPDQPAEVRSADTTVAGPEPVGSSAAGGATGSVPVIECVGLSKCYRLALGYEIEALSNLNLEVRRGETFAIVGPNGSGKTTTLKLLLGLIFPTSGEALILGEPPRSRRAKQRIGFMPEGPFFYQHMNGDEVVRFYGRLCGLRGKDLRDRTEELLTLVGMSKRRDVVMSQCSKGMVQRIGLAAALVNDPDLVMMDEPTSGLDPIGAHEIKELIVRLRDAGKTVLMCSHLLEQVEEVCDRIAIFHRGRRLAYGRLDEILHTGDESELVAEGLGDDGIAKLGALADEVNRRNGQTRFVLKPSTDVFQAIDIVRAQGGQLVSCNRVRETLEEAFIRSVVESSPDSRGPVSTDAGDAGPAASKRPRSPKSSGDTKKGGEE